MEGQKNPSRPGRRSSLAAAADGGRVAHKKSTLLNGINRAAEPSIVTTVWGTELETSLPIGLPQHHQQAGLLPPPSASLIMIDRGDGAT